MQRIFWRHAQAGWATNDLERSLTDIGLQQAQTAANWLKSQHIDFPVYTSQALRTQQTGAFFAKPIQTLSGLNPDGYMADVYAALDEITVENAIIVGHLPWIGKIIGQYLEKDSGYIEVNTAEIFWLIKNDGKWELKGHFSN